MNRERSCTALHCIPFRHFLPSSRDSARERIVSKSREREDCPSWQWHAWMPGKCGSCHGVALEILRARKRQNAAIHATAVRAQAQGPKRMEQRRNEKLDQCKLRKERRVLHLHCCGCARVGHGLGARARETVQRASQAAPPAALAVSWLRGARLLCTPCRLLPLAPLLAASLPDDGASCRRRLVRRAGCPTMGRRSLGRSLEAGAREQSNGIESCRRGCGGHDPAALPSFFRGRAGAS